MHCSRTAIVQFLAVAILVVLLLQQHSSKVHCCKTIAWVANYFQSYEHLSCLAAVMQQHCVPCSSFASPGICTKTVKKINNVDYFTLQQP